MNDWSASHYCSGGESGWTMYLDQSYTTSEHRFGGGGGGGIGENYREKESKVRAEEEEEEDLSMVSDASSGPPNYIEDNEECFYNNGYSSYAFSASESARNFSKKEEEKKKGKQNGRNQQHSYLDDTASSPVFGYGKSTKINGGSSNEALEENAVDFSQGFSATHFKKKTGLRKHFGFYRSGKSGAEE